MRSLAAELAAFFRASLIERVEGDPVAEEEPRQLFRRRLVVGITIVVGATVLGVALSVAPGDPLFYAATIGLALVWALGAFASGTIHLGQARRRDGGSSRSVLQGAILGMMLLSVFLAGALFVGNTGWLLGSVQELLDHARFGSMWAVIAITALNGVTEEIFFRGAVFSAAPRGWQVRVSTLFYAASTLASGVPLLTFAALCLGVLTSLQRRVTGGVLGPVVTHLVWSLGMLILLPTVLAVGIDP